VDEEKPLSKEKIIPEETIRPDEPAAKPVPAKKPGRKKRSARQAVLSIAPSSSEPDQNKPAEKSSRLVENFFKKNSVASIPIPAEKSEEAPKNDLKNLNQEIPPFVLTPPSSPDQGRNPDGQEKQIADKKEFKDEPEAKPDVFAKEESQDQKKKWLKRSLIALAICLVLGLLGLTGYFYYKYKIASQANPAENEAQTYAAKIGKFILLPAEEPTLATVADIEKLKDQPFFANAQNGDKVLFFTQAQKALLYRPAENKVIEIMAISSSTALEPSLPDQGGNPGESSVNQESADKASAESWKAEQTVSEEQTPAESQLKEAPPKTVKVAVYNGTSTKGLAKNISEKISALSGVEIGAIANAEGVYAKTIIIDLSGNNEAFVQSLMEKIGGEESALPEGEQKPEADILIISGSDFKAD